MMDLRAFVEFVRSQCSVPARPEPGRCPARIHYFTVECADGKRVLAYDSTKRGGAVRAARRLDHQESSDDRHE